MKPWTWNNSNKWNNNKTPAKNGQKKLPFKASPFLCYYGIQIGPESSDIHLGYSNNLFRAIQCFKERCGQFEPKILFTISNIPTTRMQGFSIQVRKANQELEEKSKRALPLSSLLYNLKWKLETFRLKNIASLHCWERQIIEKMFIENGLLQDISHPQNETFKWKSVDNERLPLMEDMKKACEQKQEQKGKLIADLAAVFNDAPIIPPCQAQTSSTTQADKIYDAFLLSL